MYKLIIKKENFSFCIAQISLLINKILIFLQDKI